IESGRIRASPQAPAAQRVSGPHRMHRRTRAALRFRMRRLRMPARSTFVSFMSAIPNSDQPGSPANPPKLHRALKARHLTMIAIGGSIGTGLF
ncbi:hypothetical protein, partial [Burkholderia cenocepacia]|uniref:hypothetical protein n=1 Tax=Burkholderia cenocepacia TaxID=95486 RepID=UPI001955B575